MAVERNDEELSFGAAVRYSAVGGCYVCAYDPSDWCDVCAYVPSGGCDVCAYAPSGGCDVCVYGPLGWCAVWTQWLGYGQALMLADAGELTVLAP